MKNNNPFPVSVVIPMKDSETTIIKTLTGLLKQKYPIREIIVVDNASDDSSVAVTREFSKAHKKIPIYIYENKVNKGVGGSYNRGVSKSTSSHLVFMHSDSTLRHSHELTKLVEPFYKEGSVVATFSSIILPQKVWLTYSFWQQVLFARTVDKKIPGLNTKFDCIERQAFKKIGGFDAVNYGQHIGVGSEDAAIHYALKSVGKVIKSNATVIHLHYLGGDFTINQFFQRKKLLARSYGRLIRLESKKIGMGIVLLLAKPILTIVLVLSFFYPPLFAFIILYVIANDWGMYSRIGTTWNKRIVMLPIITILLIVLEGYWTAESFLFLKRR